MAGPREASVRAKRVELAILARRTCLRLLVALAGLALTWTGTASAQTVLAGSGECRFQVDGARDFGNVLTGTLATSLITVTPVPPTQIGTFGFRLDPATPREIGVDGRAGPPPMVVQVSFIPTKVQVYAGNLLIQAYGPNLSLCGEASVDLKGTGVIPFALDPAKLSFGPQLIGVPSSPLSFNVITNGATNFTLQSLNDAFAVTPEKFPGPKNQKATVVFTPAMEGGYTGTILVTATNSGIAIQPQEVRIDGYGMHPLRIVTPETLPLSKIHDKLLVRLEATGGFRTHSWSLTANQTLPPGLSLAANGTLSGAPDKLGKYTFEVQVADLANQVQKRKFSLEVRTSLTEIKAATDAAAFTAERGIAPGSLLSLFGVFGEDLQVASEVPLPTELEGVSVRMTAPAAGGSGAKTVAAPLLFASPGQINLQVPWEVAAAADVGIVVKTPSGESAPMKAQVARLVPSLFTLTGSGSGPAVAVNPDGTLAQPAGCCSGAAARPARRGEGLILYATGLGPLDPPEVTGDSSTTVIRTCVERVRAFFGGFEAPVAFAGQAPGFVGVYQINVLATPSRAPVGDAVALRLDVGEERVQTQPGVTVAIEPALPGP